MVKANETHRYSVNYSKETTWTSSKLEKLYEHYADAAEAYKEKVIESADFLTLIDGEITISITYCSAVTGETRILKTITLTADNSL